MPSKKSENSRIILSLLQSVEQDGAQSQRRLAAELGIALGLVNAYLKRCVQKGYLKVSEIPTRRFAYYLTPHGFSEKSRLSVEYLVHSFSFFRQAKLDCLATFESANHHGFDRLVLAGVSDLAEIAIICAHESGIEIVAIVDSGATVSRFVGIPVVTNYDLLSNVHGVVVTDLRNTQETTAFAVERFGSRRVLVPSLLKRIGAGVEVAG